ncbi:MAG: class I SAM-dependent methyltransferase [Clostridia bacterium]|nr:class I SAM-dependent methyltransferase [Clostridia bacterium]MBQ8368490.1 class I SAM-dependent methyltransferase [Clostridia bacterium]
MKTELSCREHYDALIDENNDPVHDPAPLRDYMDKWDGQTFLDALSLTGSESVLEIGVGTGRLALKIAPLCGHFTGIDLSEKTAERARENLAGHPNVTVLTGDFTEYGFCGTFDVICSSLTFMHIEDKQQAVSKAASLLSPGGRLVISIDKNPADVIDCGTRLVKIHPDSPENISLSMKNAGLTVVSVTGTEFAHILSAIKDN